MYALLPEPEAKRRPWTLALGAAIALTCSAAGHTWLASLPPTPLPAVTTTTIKVVHFAKPVEKKPVEEPPAPKPVAASEPRPAVPRRPTQKDPVVTPNPTPAPEPATPTPLLVGLTLSSASVGGHGPRLTALETSGGNTGKPRAATAADHTAAVNTSTGQTSLGLGEYRSVTQVSATLLRGLTPVYPKAAKRAGIEGEVVLAIVISAEGRVEAATVLKGLGYGLDESAVDAAKRTEWRPASANGQAIRSTQRFSVRFALRG